MAQTLTVKVTDPTHAIFSFILTARLASNVSTQAGTFTAGTGSTVAGMDIEASSFTSSTWTLYLDSSRYKCRQRHLLPDRLAAGSPGTTTSGNGIYQSQFTLTSASVAPTPDFSLSATSATLSAGGTGTSTVTVTPANGFSGTVGLSASGLPSGVTFSPSSITGTSTLTFTPTSAAATGSFPVTLTGTSGSLTHTSSINVAVNAAAVPNFTLSASPNSLNIT